MKNPNCIFCSIIEKKITANIVLETESCLAFHDINPIAQPHLLIIPKVHIESMNALDEKNVVMMSELMLMAKNLASQFNVDKSGFRLVINTGKNAGQTVFHLHLHLLGGRDFLWPPG